MGALLGVNGAGFVTTPGANGVIATCTMPVNINTIYVYRILVRTGYNAGTPAGPEQTSGGNMQLKLDDVQAAKLATPPVVGPGGYVTFEFLAFMNGGEVVTVNAIGAATSGVVYNAQIVVMPAETPSIVG